MGFERKKKGEKGKTPCVGTYVWMRITAKTGDIQHSGNWKV
jgi:hypothetical protein